MFGRLNLRTRLLFSYLLLLLISLGVIAGALVILFSRIPAPREQTYEQFASTLRGLNGDDLSDALTVDNRRSIPQQASIAINNLADSSNYRVLQLQSQSNGYFTIVQDSADLFSQDSEVVFQIEEYRSSNLAPILPNGFIQIYGRFEENESWLFGGIGRIIRTDFGRNSYLMVVLAQPSPKKSLQESLDDFFGSVLLQPLLQAGVVGLVIAVALAFMISRGIARPLQAVAMAVPEIANGRYDQRVPVNGPPEVKAVATAFNQMSEAVSIAQKSQRDFLANVSHDLKTPLTSIQGYSQAIIDGTAKEPEKAAQIIYEEADRLNRMVVELTDLARLQSGRLSIQTTALDIGEIASAIAQRLSVVARKKDVELVVEATRMPEIAGDGDRLAQVLTNLISNAIKFTPTGGTIHIKTQIHNQGVEVIIQDSGIGIAQEDLSRIFERFYQADKARGPKRGTGLGLAIVKEIVEAHGGHIAVYSEGIGKGTTFSLWFPSPYLSTLVNRRILS